MRVEGEATPRGVFMQMSASAIHPPAGASRQHSGKSATRRREFSGREEWMGQVLQCVSAAVIEVSEAELLRNLNGVIVPREIQP